MIFTVNGFLNSGSKDMNVNGSVTPVTFSYSPGSGAVAVTGITCLFKDDGTTSLNKFGALTALTNGVVIQATQNGSTTTMTTIKDNADLCTRFHFNQFGNGAVLSILAIATAEGFGASNNIFIGYMKFDFPIILQGADSIGIVIQDDLRNIDEFQMACKVGLDS